MEAEHRGDAIAVISPLLGGFYFGGLLAGIADRCNEAGRPVIAVQTLDPGLRDSEYQTRTDFRLPAALDEACGLIVVLNAAGDDLVRSINARGVPAVSIGRQYDELRAPAVLSDNRGGARSAVEHLLGHGHRAIAFVGDLDQAEIWERYQSYRQTLGDHGITPDPRLVYRVGDNLTGGGRDGGQRLLAAEVPATAVLAATDLNAVGVMEVLIAAGHRVPEDVAVMGFDDAPEGVFTNPSLSTVRQDLPAVGRLAAELLLKRVAGADLPVRQHHLRTSLVGRESCGCPPARWWLPEVDGRSSGDAAAGDTTVDRAAPGSGADRNLPAAHAPYRDTRYFKQLLQVQHEVSMDLLLSHIQNPRALGWLGRTAARAGCLALWSPEPAEHDHALTIVGAFDREGSDLELTVGRTIPVEQFPPVELVRQVVNRRGEVVHVVPVRMRGNNWGLLAIAIPVDDRMPMGRETVNQWAALLCVALDREAVFKSLRQREESLRRAALYDHLTGLPNRVLFAERVRDAIDTAKDDTAKDQKRRFAVLFLDLDGFKVVNDSLGHHCGDRLLVQVANRIRTNLTAGDMPARLGGDEFAVFIDDIRPGKTPESVAARVTAALAEPFRIEGRDVVISASIGIAVSDARYADAQEMMRDADIAMYQAKAEAKGSHTKFKVGMRRVAMQRLQIEADLRGSIENGDFALHYQPIVDMSTGRPVSAEALLRWRHPTRGLLAPSEFIAVAEEVGLTVPIGRWALSRTLADLNTWVAAGRVGDGFRVTLNVSNRQFWHTDLLDDIKHCLTAGGLTTSRISLEITEGVIMQDAEAALRILRRLHAAGIELDIDDFGTGYSSLSALLRLPIDKLKIDRSFVARIVTDDRSRILVQTIVQMAHDLHLTVIAEGVETGAQRDHLLELGCRYGQGYLFAQPRPFEQFTDQLVAPPADPAAISAVHVR